MNSETVKTVTRLN